MSISIFNHKIDVICLVLVLIFCPFFPSRFHVINELQFILLGLLCIFSFTKSQKVAAANWKVVLFFGLFILQGFLSFFFAHDRSLIWFDSFNWLLVLLCLLSVNQNNSLSQEQFKILGNYFLIVFLAVGLFSIIVSSVSPELNLTSLISKNTNFLCFGISFFLPFSKAYYKLPFRIVLFLLSVLICIYFETIGALIIVMLCLFYVVLPKEHLVKVSQLKFALLLCSSLFALVCFCSVDFNSLYHYLEGCIGGRIYMATSSIKLFFENPFLGLGVGNWDTFAYQYLTSESNYDFCHDVMRPRNHNHILLVLSERGSLGIMLFVMTFYSTTVDYLRTKASVIKLIVLIIYVYLCTIYSSINSHQYHFSIIQYFFFSYFFFRKYRTSKFSGHSIIRLLCLLARVLVVIWFSFILYQNHKYFIYRNSKDLESPIRFESLVISPIYTQAKHNQPLYYESGLQYLSKKDTSKAIKYFELADSISPYHFDNNLRLANLYCLSDQDELSKSKLDKLNAIQPSHLGLVLQRTLFYLNNNELTKSLEVLLESRCDIQWRGFELLSENIWRRSELNSLDGYDYLVLDELIFEINLLVFNTLDYNQIKKINNSLYKDNLLRRKISGIDFNFDTLKIKSSDEDN